MNSQKAVDSPIQMSVQRTRPQYAFIQNEEHYVSLLGPTQIVSGIHSSCDFTLSRKCFAGDIISKLESSASTAKLGLSRFKTNTLDTMFLKATLLEEVLKHGFEPISNVTDDPVVLCRRVDFMQQTTGT